MTTDERLERLELALAVTTRQSLRIGALRKSDHSPGALAALEEICSEVEDREQAERTMAERARLHGELAKLEATR